MVSVIILDNGEPNVIQLTFENLYKELKDIYGSELLVRKDWFDLEGIKNRYVCFVEADCLVEPGYFQAQLERFKKRGFSRVTGIMSASTAVTYWDNRIYGYRLGSGVMGVMPNRKQKSSAPFSVQVAYIPGSIMRMTMLKEALKDMEITDIHNDLVFLSSELSLAFWKRGYRIYVNPKISYLTTEDYVNDIGQFGVDSSVELDKLFLRESI